MTFPLQSAFFARLSNLAYKNPKEAQKIFSKMEYKSTFYEHNGSQAYVIEDTDDIIIVCRGTEPKEWKDIQADLTIDRVPSRAGVGQVHRGFRNYTDHIWELIKNHVLDAQKTTWLTGHSLGAAMATLMARRFVLDPINHPVEGLFTFGSPRVGDRTYIDTFNDKVTHHRWVNEGDIVTKVPFPPFYYHCGTKHHIGQSGLIIKNVEKKNILVRALKLGVGKTKALFSLLVKDSKDHSSELYVQRISFWAMNYTGDDE